MITLIGFGEFVAEVIEKSVNIRSPYFGQKEWHHIVPQNATGEKTIREEVFERTELNI